ncbi:tetracycline efflux protein [Lichtheimia corymbifera JMRC:FSU:9682]|uniref:Tetracycline efflux protein n=1 Tax=Lichtheimia corymbifera JMRC:FSU:9682 TaxID=1263082 RepID=A0A068SJ48_9FUNG|nr:tetracycline efflux protein [Lichtheimia corymbifera JMRC:FSU:9682]
MEVDERTIVSDKSASENAAGHSNEKPVSEKRRRWNRIIVFFSLQLSLFLAALDNTIVATSLPRIGSEFQQMAISAWVVNSYILTLDSFQPLFSKFSDIFGRKYVLVVGIIVFLLGSVLCGVSKTMLMLIICRAVQGIGAASVFVIISDLVPLEKRGSYQGIVNAVFAVASVFGPLIGGSLTDYVSWRWNFYINLPIGGVAVVILVIFLHLPMEKQDLKTKLKRVDYAGNFLVLAAATLLLLAMNFGGQTFPWKSAAVIVPFILVGVLVALLVVVEVKYAREPLLPPRLFKNRSVVSVLISNVFFGLTFFAAVYYLPIYFQIVRNDTAMWSGIRLIPMQMMICVFSTAAGFFISKFGIYRPLITIGMTLLTLCIGLISLFDVDTSWSMVYGITVIGGTGMGLMFSSTIIALQAAVETKDIAVVTGLNNFSRVLGGALGVAIASAVLNSFLQKNLPGVLPEQYVQEVFNSPEYIRNGLPEEYILLATEVYVDSLRYVWYILIAMSSVGLLSSFFTKHHPLRRPPPPQPAADNAANGNNGSENGNSNSNTAAEAATENAANDDTSSEHHVAVEISNKPEAMQQVSCRG